MLARMAHTNNSIVQFGQFGMRRIGGWLNDRTAKVTFEWLKNNNGWLFYSLTKPSILFISNARSLQDFEKNDIGLECNLNKFTLCTLHLEMNGNGQGAVSCMMHADNHDREIKKISLESLQDCCAGFHWMGMNRTTRCEKKMPDLQEQERKKDAKNTHTHT